MYSNFITPPDFVDEQKHSITIVEATEKEIELLYNIARSGTEDYNIYLYRLKMDDSAWLTSAIDRSNSVIVNLDRWKDLEIFKSKNVFYYGQGLVVSPAQKINSLLDYFYISKFENK
jgi:hypothetical protein